MNSEISAHAMMESLRNQIREVMPESPVIHGWKSFSQCDEDGIIRECLLQISNVVDLSRTFIEIGCGNGLENNTHQLLLDGYVGSWVDGSKDNIAFAVDQLSGVKSPRLIMKECIVTQDNVRQLIVDIGLEMDTSDLDFLSVDIDGNDCAIVEGCLTEISPKLICVEYNAKFPPYGAKNGILTLRLLHDGSN